MGEAVALIDYGAGNLHSVDNALTRVGADVALVSDGDALSQAERIVLPGVGAFGACYNGLASLPGMIEALERRVLRDGVPFLGICVGMQLLADRGLEHGEGVGCAGRQSHPVREEQHAPRRQPLAQRHECEEGEHRRESQRGEEGANDGDGLVELDVHEEREQRRRRLRVQRRQEAHNAQHHQAARGVARGFGARHHIE